MYTSSNVILTYLCTLLNLRILGPSFLQTVFLFVSFFSFWDSSSALVVSLMVSQGSLRVSSLCQTLFFLPSHSVISITQFLLSLTVFCLPKSTFETLSQFFILAVVFATPKFPFYFFLTFLLIFLFAHMLLLDFLHSFFWSFGCLGDYCKVFV